MSCKDDYSRPSYTVFDKTMEQRHIRLCLEKNANCRGKPQNNNTSVINKSNAINVSENCHKTVGGDNKRFVA